MNTHLYPLLALLFGCSSLQQPALDDPQQGHPAYNIAGTVVAGERSLVCELFDASSQFIELVDIPARSRYRNPRAQYVRCLNENGNPVWPPRVIGLCVFTTSMPNCTERDPRN